jgi:hypothetical protein
MCAYAGDAFATGLPWGATQFVIVLHCEPHSNAFYPMAFGSLLLLAMRSCQEEKRHSEMGKGSV